MVWNAASSEELYQPEYAYYHRTNGVQTDRAKSVECYKQAAEQEHASSQLIIGQFKSEHLVSTCLQEEFICKELLHKAFFKVCFS